MRRPRARCARGPAHRRERAAAIEARLVAEGANGPTSIEADAILAERGIPVLPDVLTNAGGVTVSYFEWVQDLGRLFWDRDEIRARLAEKLADAFDRVWMLSEERGDHAARCRARRGHSRGRGRARGARDLSLVTPRPRRDGARPADARRVGVGAGGRRAGSRIPACAPCSSATRARSSASSRARRSCARSSPPAAIRRGRVLGEIAEPPIFTLDADAELETAFRELEERDLERVPVTENGRLVGILSRAVVQRRLAEDEPPRRRSGLASSRCRRRAARRPRPAPAARPRRARRRGAGRARSPRARRARSGAAPRGRSSRPRR